MEKWAAPRPLNTSAVGQHVQRRIILTLAVCEIGKSTESSVLKGKDSVRTQEDTLTSSPLLNSCLKRIQIRGTAAGGGLSPQMLYYSVN